MSRLYNGRCSDRTRIQKIDLEATIRQLESAKVQWRTEEEQTNEEKS